MFFHSKSPLKRILTKTKKYLAISFSEILSQPSLLYQTEFRILYANEQNIERKTTIMTEQKKNGELQPIRHWISMKNQAVSIYLVKLETYRDSDHFMKLEDSMKKIIYIVAVSFLSAAFTGSSFAGDVQEKQQQLQEKQLEVKEKQIELNQERQKEAIERTQESNKSMQQVSRASKIIGTKVKNPNDENLGDIKDLVIDPESGQVVYGVVSFGGVLGMGDKLFAIPWDALRWNPDKKYYVLDLDKDTLKKAPGFDKKHWPDTSNKWERLREELNQFPFYHPKG